jgi:hypothetical protein
MPGSEAILGGSEQPPVAVGTSTGTFTVQAVGAARRASFARTGRLTLTVNATVAGRVTVHATALLHAKRQMVASAAGSIAGVPGHKTFTLRLSPAARQALAKRGRLAVSLQVTFSASSAVKTTQLSLVRATSSSHAATRHDAGGRAQ